MAAPSLLVQRPQTLALATVWRRSRRGKVRSQRRGRDDNVRCRGGLCATRDQEEDHSHDQRDSHRAIAPTLPEVRRDYHHLKLPGSLANILVVCLRNVVTASANIAKNCCFVPAATSPA